MAWRRRADSGEESGPESVCKDVSPKVLKLVLGAIISEIENPIMSLHWLPVALRIN